MQLELAPLRRARDLLQQNLSADEIVDQLQSVLGLDYVGAIAAVAAGSLLNDRGLAVTEEPFARPFVRDLVCVAD